jgi:hypothetical protein
MRPKFHVCQHPGSYALTLVIECCSGSVFETHLAVLNGMVGLHVSLESVAQIEN